MWHVGDLNISHIDPKAVYCVIKQLKKNYGKDSPITVTRGVVHKYLGMTIDFYKEDKVVIRVDDYVSDIL